jgi:citrate lyase subunit beta/citryl-CoA lyase
MLAKARSLPADEIVIDLEDSVAEGAKDEARAAACAAIAEGGWAERSIAVRINAIESPWWERDVTDLAQLDGGGPATLVVPKVESATEVEAVERVLDAAEGKRPAGSRIGLQALVETARGLVNAGEIGGAGLRLESLIVGYADLAASLGRRAGAEYPGDRWHWVRETVLANARAAGLAAIDGPWLEIADEQGMRESASSARALGFDGKWAIHPSQIEALNEVFSPTREEFERARSVLDALEASGEGAVKLDGAMIDEASRKQAAAIVARGEAGGLRAG